MAPFIYYVYLKSVQAWITQFYLLIHHACLSFVGVHQMAPPLTEVSQRPINRKWGPESNYFQCLPQPHGATENYANGSHLPFDISAFTLLH